MSYKLMHQGTKLQIQHLNSLFKIRSRIVTYKATFRFKIKNWERYKVAIVRTSDLNKEVTTMKKVKTARQIQLAIYEVTL